MFSGGGSAKFSLSMQLCICVHKFIQILNIYFIMATDIEFESLVSY